MPKRLSKVQRKRMLDLIERVNDGQITSRRELLDYIAECGWEQWLASWTVYSAGENMPGYMPDSPYSLFLTERAARGYCYYSDREPGGQAYVSDYMPVTLLEVL